MRAGEEEVVVPLENAKGMDMWTYNDYTKSQLVETRNTELWRAKNYIAGVSITIVSVA